MAEFEKGGRTFEMDRTQKGVDYDQIAKLTGQPAPTPAEVATAAQRPATNVVRVAILSDAGRQEYANPALSEGRASAASAPVAFAGRSQPRRPTTAWAVLCDSHGRICLSSEEYDAQMNDANSLWKCPIAGCRAEWDDDWHEAMTEDMEPVAWETDE